MTTHHPSFNKKITNPFDFLNSYRYPNYIENVIINNNFSIKSDECLSTPKSTLSSPAGIIYLLQPAELIGTNRFKIGCSNNSSLVRCKNGYRKGTRYIAILECEKPFEIEKEIKETFKRKFKLIAGAEFFEGDEKDIKKEFFKITI